LEPDVTHEENDEILLPPAVSPAQIFETIQAAIKHEFGDKRSLMSNVRASLTPPLLTNMLQGIRKVVYGLSVRCKRLMKEEILIEIEENAPLDILHEYICSITGIHPDFDYSICIGETETPFNTYIYGAQIKSRCTQTATFETLPIETGTTLRYTIHGMEALTFSPEATKLVFDIIVTKKIKARYGRVYPWHKTIN
jgi:hypothetical protein